MPALSGRKGRSATAPFRRLPVSALNALAGCVVAVLFAAAASASRSGHEIASPPAVSRDAATGAATIPHVRTVVTGPIAVGPTPVRRDPFAFADTAPAASGPAAEAPPSTMSLPPEAAPSSPVLPQFIGIISNTSASGPQYRAVFATRDGELWFAAEGDSRDGFTARHLSADSVDLEPTGVGRPSHLTLP